MESRQLSQSPSTSSAVSFLNCISYTFFINRFKRDTMFFKCCISVAMETVAFTPPQLSRKIEVSTCFFQAGKLSLNPCILRRSLGVGQSNPLMASL